MDIQRRSAWLSIQIGPITIPFKFHLKPQFLLVCILFSLFFSQQLHAAIYKCIDESGKKIFSGSPCQQGTKSIGTIDEAKTPPHSKETVEKIGSVKAVRAEDLPKGVVPVIMTGRITFTNGDPIVGAEVLSWGLKDKKSGFKGMATTRTDANGYYELSIDNRYLWVIYHHGSERREFSRKGPWQSNTTIDFFVPVE